MADGDDIVHQKAIAPASSSDARTELGTPTPANIATRFADKIFAERKGHGGGPCSYMQVTPQMLREIIQGSIEVYIEATAAIAKATGSAP